MSNPNTPTTSISVVEKRQPNEHTKRAYHEGMKLIKTFDWKVFRVWMKTIPEKGIEVKKPKGFAWSKITDAELSEKNLKGLEDYQGIAVAVVPSGLWVLDIDPPKEGEKDGVAYMNLWLETNNINLSRTVHTLTPSGGRHYFFKANQRIKQGARLNFPACGNLPAGKYSIDIRSVGRDKEDKDGNIKKSAGGYVVLPPSFNYDKGVAYQWGLSPYDVPIVDAPEPLIQLIESSSSFKTKTPVPLPLNLKVSPLEVASQKSGETSPTPLPTKKKQTKFFVDDPVDDDPSSNPAEVSDDDLYEKVRFAVMKCWKIQRLNSESKQLEFITRDNWRDLGCRLKMLAETKNDERYHELFHEWSIWACSQNPEKWKDDPHGREEQWRSYNYETIQKPCSEIFFWAAKGNPKDWFAAYPRFTGKKPVPPFTLTSEMFTLVFGPEADVALAVAIAMKPYLRFKGNKKIIFYNVQDRLWKITSNEKVFLGFIKDVLIEIMDRIKFVWAKKQRTKSEEERFEKIPSKIAEFKTRAFLGKVFDMLVSELQDEVELRDAQGNLVQAEKSTVTKIESQAGLFAKVAKARAENGNKSTSTFTKIRNDATPMTLLQRINSHPGTEHLLPFDGADGGKVINLVTGEISDREAHHFFRWSCPFDPTKGTDEGVEAMANLYFETFGTEELAMHQWIEHSSFLTGEPANGNFWNWIGPEGANGKSLISNNLSKVLGLFYLAMSSETVLKGSNGHNRDGHKPRPDRLLPMGKRLSVVPEIPEGGELDSEFMKKLSSPDEISYRDLQAGTEDYITYKPICKTVIISNFPAIFNANDGGVLRRARYRKFTNRFVDDPTLPHEKKKDVDLERKICPHSSFKFYIQGAMEWYRLKKTLVEPQAFVEAKVEFVEQVDYMTQFINHHVRPTNSADTCVKVTDAYDLFQMSGLKNLTKIQFGKEFKIALCKNFNEKSIKLRDPHSDEEQETPVKLTFTDSIAKGWVKGTTPGSIHVIKSNGIPIIRGIRLIGKEAHERLEL